MTSDLRLGCFKRLLTGAAAAVTGAGAKTSTGAGTGIRAGALAGTVTRPVAVTTADTTSKPVAVAALTTTAKSIAVATLTAVAAAVAAAVTTAVTTAVTPTVAAAVTTAVATAGQDDGVIGCRVQIRAGAFSGAPLVEMAGYCAPGRHSRQKYGQTKNQSAHLFSWHPILLPCVI